MLSIYPIPAFNDNYIWCVYSEQTKRALLVDPGCHKASSAFLEKNGLALDSILVTHHHPDHTGGIKSLKQKFPETRIIGFKQANHPYCDIGISEGETITLLGTIFDVIEVPGHTLDHIAFFSQADSLHTQPWLFCGDTLFSGGCGRLFEGTAEQMYRSLHKLTSLPPTTQVCCAHEYTLANLEFAKSVMPTNTDLNEHINTCIENREQGLPTLPSTIETELKINPFLRVSDEDIRQRFNQEKQLEHQYADVSIFAALRKAKDNF